MSTQTQLAAIVFTDIVGYTRLMGSDESKALEILQLNRQIQKPLIDKYNGRFIKELGDGTMASFAKASDAVRCAIEIQKATKDIPDLNLRIGNHLGEVVFENDDVFGDAVNIAARIESAGRSEAIFVSHAVNSVVHAQGDIETRFIEQMHLKNVNRPIDIYEVAIDGVFTKADKKILKEKPNSRKPILLIGFVLLMAALGSLWWMSNDYGLTSMNSDGKASIAVLPFTNMSNDPDNEFFCDGVTEDILTQLSKLRNLKVISRTSVMHFKNSELTIPEIAKELGVEYVVEGSVRKQGDQVAITAQLIHAGNDDHLWAESYQRQLNDVFAIQREVATEVSKVLNIKISVQEKQGLAHSSTENIEAYQLLLKAREAADDRKMENIKRANDMLRKALEIDPNYVDAKAQLAYNYLIINQKLGYRKNDSIVLLAKQLIDEAMLLDSTNANVYIAYYGIVDREKPSQAKNKALKRIVDKAIQFGPNNAYAHIRRSFYYGLINEIDSGLSSIRRAIEIDPFSVYIQRHYVYSLCHSKKIEEAKVYVEKNKEFLAYEGDEHQEFIKGYIYSKDWNNVVKEGRLFHDVLLNRDIEKYYNSIYWNINHMLLLDPEIERYVDLARSSAHLSYFSAKNYIDLLSRMDKLREAYVLLDNLKKRWGSERERELAYLESLILFYDGRYKDIEELYAKTNNMKTSSFRYYSWIQLGRGKEVRNLLTSDSINGTYARTLLYTGLGDIENALDNFEKEEQWRDIANSRFVPQLKPLWNEPRYKAKVASYGFPDVEHPEVK
jgi:TolB-like protein/class 3 adenylate cyclase